MEKFLATKYHDLPGSKSVERSVEKAKRDPERAFVPHTREERIATYLDRLDYIVRDERGWRRLKHKLMREFTIDVDDKDAVMKIAHGLYESEKRLAIEQGRGGDIAKLESSTDVLARYEHAINEKHDIQERTFSAWLEYLHQNDAQYPTWFRYFVVRSLGKMGIFDKGKAEYSKRTDHTIAPFPELNSEALGFVYRMLTTGIGHQEFLDEPEKREHLRALVAKKDFAKLYAFAQIETAGALNRESLQGEWVKYERGSDHRTLENALRGKGTGWCTAEGSAYAHLHGGDFHVYFTRGVHGTYSEPRIAIRMEDDHVAEVRGVNHRQELEPELIDVAAGKYRSLPGGDRFEKKTADMKHMTDLVRMHTKGELFSRDDLMFLYEVESEIEGFGYERDPRIDEVRNARNRKDDIRVMCDCDLEHIANDVSEMTLDTHVLCADDGKRIAFVDFRMEKHAHKLPQIIEIAHHLTSEHSPATLDTSFEGGIVSLTVPQETVRALQTWPTAREAYVNADGGSPPWVNDMLKDYPYTPLTASHIDFIVLNHGKTTPQERDTLVSTMAKAGYRPPTLAELMPLGIIRPDLNRRDEILNAYKPHPFGGVLHAPCLDWVGSRRNLFPRGVSSEWDGRVRFLFVRT